MYFGNYFKVHHICLQAIPKDFLQQLLVWMRIFLLAQENQIMPNQITIVPMNFIHIVANASILISGKDKKKL